MQQQKVDILLTDIQMPDITGIEFIQHLNYKPSIIFTTAYSEYAIDGYDLGVIDYLLKPISFPRFFKAINKAIGKLRISNISHKTAEIEDPVAKNEQKDYLLIKADYKVYKVDFEDLIYLEGKQEYVTFHTKQRNITAHYSLKKLIEELPEKQFIRIHKSYIIALKYVEIIEGNHIIITGEKLPIGGTYREAVMEIFE
ncbi:MAG: LytTR family DNA-binding domain-containing protein, partial [Bacteroidales bacterium]